MRLLTRLSFAVVLLLGPTVAAANAATAAQLVELMHAGLSDDILIALIQSDGSTFQLTAADILSLHRQGLSNKVILAMQETARKVAKTAEREAQPPACEPLVVRPEQLVQPAPAVVNVYQTVTQRVEPSRSAISQYVPIPVAVPVFVRPAVTRPVEPVYWGWGGQRRPDSWQDAKDTKAPTSDEKKKGGL